MPSSCFLLWILFIWFQRSKALLNVCHSLIFSVPDILGAKLVVLMYCYYQMQTKWAYTASSTVISRITRCKARWYFASRVNKRCFCNRYELPATSQMKFTASLSDCLQAHARWSCLDDPTMCSLTGEHSQTSAARSCFLHLLTVCQAAIFLVPNVQIQKASNSPSLSHAPTQHTKSPTVSFSHTTH